MFPKSVEIRAEIMVMMLNGTMDWNKGCFLRNLSDETLLELYEEIEKQIREES